MAQRSTLVQVADNRVFRDIRPGEDLARALNEAYPFGDDPRGREVWLEAFHRKQYMSERSIKKTVLVDLARQFLFS